uniref:Uncharacterized protein n=1 Tax=Anguilla anguilla TaxID=7936 RepID=A0A0E9TSY3_ANGAN
MAVQRQTEGFMIFRPSEVSPETLFH